MVQVLSWYHDWFWNSDNFRLLRIDQKCGNRKYPRLAFCSIYGGCDILGISYLPRISLIKCYWQLQNAKVRAFTVSELLRKNQHGEIKLPPTMIRVKISYFQKSLASNDSFWLFTNIEKRYGISFRSDFLHTFSIKYFLLNTLSKNQVSHFGEWPSGLRP